MDALQPPPWLQGDRTKVLRGSCRTGRATSGLAHPVTRRALANPAFNKRPGGPGVPVVRPRTQRLLGQQAQLAREGATAGQRCVVPAQLHDRTTIGTWAAAALVCC